MNDTPTKPAGDAAKTDAAKATPTAAQPKPESTPAATPADDSQAPAGDPAAPVLSPEDNDVVQLWLSGYVRGGPIARNVECWNALSDALPHLVAALKKGD